MELASSSAAIATALGSMVAGPRRVVRRLGRGASGLFSRSAIGRALMSEPGTTSPCADTRFAQARLGVFAGLLFWLTLLGFLMANAVTHAGIPRDPGAWLHPSNLAHLGAVAVFGAVWLGTRHGVRSSLAIGALDLGGTVAAITLLSLMARYLPLELRPELASRHLVMLLAATNVLIVRSVLVPARPTVTLAVGIAVAVPVLFIAVAVEGPGAPGNRAIYAFTWLVFAIATSTVVTSMIYGLRRRVREARRLGQYTLGELLGEGGMGSVYRASHAMLRRPTAVKLLDVNAVGERGLERFEKEVQLTAELTHPSTIGIYDYGRTSDGLFYYAMELVDGLDLMALVDRYGPMPPSRVAALMQQACGSLAEAHLRGLVHRDIKPENMVLSCRPGQGDVLKVLDFGLVKDVRDEPEQSAPGFILGTPHFLSPESIDAPHLVGPKADLYALGGVMYYLLTGEYVFDCDNVIGLCTAHLTEDPVPPSRRCDVHVPPELERVVMTCLSKDPAHRPVSAAAVAAMLENATPERWNSLDAMCWWSERAPQAPAA